MEQDPHVRRLLLEQERLINLAGRSDFIHVEPVEVTPGLPPNKYVVTFTCKGIAGINTQKEPIPSDFHQVSIYISRDFPRHEPHLKWLTPIWHPNIEHKEPFHVCTNNVQNSYSTKGLDDLVLILGEMVQYRRYHAVWEQPWPYDKEVATWVIEYAEPHGVVGRNKPYDNRPLLREYMIRAGGGKRKQKSSPPIAHNVKATKRRGIKLGSRDASDPTGPAQAPTRKPGFTFRSKQDLDRAKK